MPNFTTTSYQDVLQSSMGQNGCTVLVPGTTLEGYFKCIIPVGDTVLNTIVCNMTYNGTATPATPAQIGTLVDCQPFFANILSVSLSSGKAFVYA